MEAPLYYYIMGWLVVFGDVWLVYVVCASANDTVRSNIDTNALWIGLDLAKRGYCSSRRFV